MGRLRLRVDVLAPRHGRLVHQLPKPLSSYELVSRHDIIYDGRQESFRVYYQADPPPQPLPAKIAGPCENPTRVDDP